jgi:hypothetical protein
MSIAKIQTANFGANPFAIEGPFGATGTGIPAPNFTLGSISWGDSEAEWVYVKLTLSGTTTMQPGLWLQWDKDYNATLLTTATAVVGLNCGTWGGPVAPTLSGGPTATQSLAAGVYYIWVQRAGQAAAVVSTGVTASILVAETTATAGQLNVPASATATTKQITPVSFAAANFTFTATTTNGSPVLTVLSGASSGSGPFLGAAVSGTGIPGSTTITGITYSPSGTVQSLTMNNNATANGTGITITAVGVLEVSLKWPYIAKVN